MTVDLHLHTTYSDGSFSPKQVVDMAKKRGVQAVAITDHDECRGYLEVKDDKDIQILSGIELSADFKGEAHVLGYNIDCTNKALIDHIEEQSVSRIKRAHKMIERFREFGIELTIDEVMQECTGDVLGRPHIADALMKKGVVSSTKEAFTRFLGRYAKCYVPRAKVDIAKAVDIIRGAGGVAVLAHPGIMPGSVWNELSGKLKDYGFWGIEAYHSEHSKGKIRELESFAIASGLFVTCGSDYHGYAKPDVDICGEQAHSRYLIQSLKELGIKCT